jgi:hypothetical protein
MNMQQQSNNGAAGDDGVVKVRYQGAWVLVDNGYSNWSSTVPPIKSSCSRAEIRFSAWLRVPSRRRRV